MEKEEEPIEEAQANEEKLLDKVKKSFILLFISWILFVYIFWFIKSIFLQKLIRLIYFQHLLDIVHSINLSIQKRNRCV